MGKYQVSDIFEGDYKVTQLYGVNASYYQQFGLAGHEGVDWATPVGIYLICPFDKGQIIRTGWDPAYGKYVVIWDPAQKCAVWYCHMSEISCSPGQTFSRNQRVGRTGATGNVTGPHLHCNFVETDQWANRLNQGNGYQGFLNILNPNLVTWILGSQPTVPLTDAQRVQKIKDIVNTSITDTDFRGKTRTILGV